MRIRVPSRAGACLAVLAALALSAGHTRGISLNKAPLFIHRNQNRPGGGLSAANAAESGAESQPNKPVDPFLRSPAGKNLFKHQVASYTHTQPETTDLSNSASWSDIVYDEVLKNRAMEAKREAFTPSSDAQDNVLGLKRLKSPHNFRLTPEGRLRLEDRIENLRRAAHSNPVQYKAERPILWIVRSSHGHYCPLLEKDEPRIKSLVARVRKHYGPSELRVLVMKVDLKMPLCEVFLEGSMPDLVRILYARGGTLQVGRGHAQYYVVPRFRTRCELIEKDPRLEAVYGKASAPGLFPRWDEDGMLEEIADCMNARPDFALGAQRVAGDPAARRGGGQHHADVLRARALADAAARAARVRARHRGLQARDRGGVRAPPEVVPRPGGRARQVAVSAITKLGRARTPSTD